MTFLQFCEVAVVLRSRVSREPKDDSRENFGAYAFAAMAWCFGCTSAE